MVMYLSIDFSSSGFDLFVVCIACVMLYLNSTYIAVGGWSVINDIFFIFKSGSVLLCLCNVFLK